MSEGIIVSDLSKIFRTHVKEPGLKGSLRSLFSRKWVEKPALAGVSLKVSPGEILGLIGDNGAGKTTLIKILAGIVKASGGEARINGFDPWLREVGFRKQIALIMGQKAQLWWDLPAADGFLLLKEIYQIPDQKYKASLEFLVETLQVKDELKSPIRKLSLGERMKMELIAALLHEPKVVFLDEPTIGLDISAQKAIRKFLLNYRQSHKPIMLLTSHYMEDIESLCERIVVIRDGKFVYDGPLSRVSNEVAHEKLIIAKFSEPNTEKKWMGPGTEIARTEDSITIKTDKTGLPQAASRLLSEFAIRDLEIEGPDIGSIIEKLMKKST